MELIGYEQSNPVGLDATFAALADPTRRAILARLSSGEATVTELAEPFAMTQPAISKHLKVLERAGLISRGRDAQRRPRRLEAKPLAQATEWLEHYRQFWEATYLQLDSLLDELKTLNPKEKHESQLQAKSEPNQLRRSTMTPTGTMQLSTPTDREIVVTRVFNAPRTIVFDAFTKPELLKRWLFGPGGWTLEVCEVDLRVGGAYRYVWRNSNGVEMGMGGIHREVVPPERIVSTQLFDQDWTGGEAVGTLILTEQDGKTTLTNTLLYSSREARDAVLKTPMDKGMGASYDRLEEMLPSLMAQGAA
jgi:uncharacterized protein YndB with AHSA1/START domain/DNA-binding transcriptional ArsR family regulator